VEWVGIGFRLEGVADLGVFGEFDDDQKEDGGDDELKHGMGPRARARVGAVRVFI
jgi:hypothetical protein